MDDNSTTEEVTQTTGATEALPVQGDQTSAETQTTEQPSEASEGEQESSLPEADDKLKNFAKAQGIEDLSELSERELRLLKVAKDNQAEFQRNRQKASELEKSIGAVSDEYAEEAAAQTGENPEVLKRLQRMEVKDAVREFWDSNPDAQQYEQKMVEILQQRPHLAGDLESLYAVARMQAGGVDAAKSQGKREALESLAQKQQAAVPKGNATNSSDMTGSKITPQNVNQMVSSMSVEEYKRRLPEINAALAGH